MHKKITRRKFISYSPALAGVSISFEAVAQSPMSESDPQAAALGYKNSATTASHAKYVNGQSCSNCALFSIRGGGLGVCPLFRNKFVSASGWCSAYSRSATASTTDPAKTQNDEIQKLQMEVSRLQEIEKQQQVNVQKTETIKPANSESGRLSLDASKKKCTELGFKPATEDHGKCVLQLSK